MLKPAPSSLGFLLDPMKYSVTHPSLGYKTRSFFFYFFIFLFLSKSLFLFTPTKKTLQSRLPEPPQVTLLLFCCQRPCVGPFTKTRRHTGRTHTCTDIFSLSRSLSQAFFIPCFSLTVFPLSRFLSPLCQIFSLSLLSLSVLSVCLSISLFYIHK